MLYPAQLYKEELKRKLIEVWYNPKYQYYFAYGRYEFTVPDNTEYRRDFVHLDKNNNVDGYFSYNYNEACKSMTNFGLVSFVDKNIDFIYDVMNHVKDMFMTKGTQRCEFWAFEDNPVNKFYSKFVEHYGGKQLATCKRCSYFNGQYHNSVIYEILVEDFVDAVRNRPRKKNKCNFKELDLVKRSDVIDITVETGALITQERVMDLPSYSVSVKQANWVTTDSLPTRYFSCSNCEKEITTAQNEYTCKYKYCPNCGAEMVPTY